MCQISAAQIDDGFACDDTFFAVFSRTPLAVPPGVAGTASYLSYAAPVFAWAFPAGEQPGCLQQTAPRLDERDESEEGATNLRRVAVASKCNLWTLFV